MTTMCPPRRTALLMVLAVLTFAGCSQERTVRSDIGEDELRDVYGIPRPVETDISERLFTNATTRLQNRHADLQSLINRDNVDDLRLAWFIQTQYPVSHQPLAEGDRVYFADWGGTVYAVDINTGDVLWSTQVEMSPQVGWPIHGFVGTGAIQGDVLFQASVEGNAYAIDKHTGEVLWQQRFTDEPMTGNLGGILAYGGLLYIGISSVEPIINRDNDEVQFRGRVVAINAADGSIAWEQVLVEAPNQGVGVSGGFALDHDAEVLYFTTGRTYGGGTSPLANSIVAIDARDGALRWFDAIEPHQAIDPDDPLMVVGAEDAFQAPPQLFEVMIDGQRIYAVGAGHKNGTYYVYNRDDGSPIGAARLGMAGEAGGITAAGSIGQQQLFLWSNNSFPMQNPAQHPMDVAAFDLATGEAIWRRPGAQPAAYNTPGFLASDVYFVPSLDGTVRAYDARNGTTIWTSDQHGGVNSGVTVASGTLLFGGAAPPPLSEAGMPNGLVAYRMDMRASQEPRLIEPPLPNLPRRLRQSQPHEVDAPPAPQEPQRRAPLRVRLDAPQPDDALSRR